MAQTAGTNSTPERGTRLVPTGLPQEHAGTTGWYASVHLKHLSITVHLFDTMCYRAYHSAAAVNVVVEVFETNPMILKTKYFPWLTLH